MHINMHSARSLTALAGLLEDCLAGDASSSNRDLQRQLQSLVQAGVPTVRKTWAHTIHRAACGQYIQQEIRGKLWRLFLKVDQKRVPGLYQELVAIGQVSFYENQQ